MPNNSNILKTILILIRYRDELKKELNELMSKYDPSNEKTSETKPKLITDLEDYIHDTDELISKLSHEY